MRMRLCQLREKSGVFFAMLMACLLLACDSPPSLMGPTSRDVTFNIIPITQVNGTSQTLTQVGLSFEFIAVDEIDGKFEDVSDNVTWHSLNPNVVKIEEGKALGINPGSSLIYAQLGSRISNEIELIVRDSLLISLQINNSKTDSPTGSLENQIAVQSKQNLLAIATYDDNTSFDVTRQVNWGNPKNYDQKSRRASTRNASISVSDGTAQMHTSGNADVQANFLGQSSNPLLFIVNSVSLSDLIISPLDVTLAKNSHQQFTAIAVYSDESRQDVTQHVLWKSDGQDIAHINRGQADALSVGSTRISASWLNKNSNFSSLRVIDAQLYELQITPSKLELDLGSDRFYKVKAIYEDGSTADISDQVLWESSQPDVTTVVAAYAKAYNVGETLITAKYQGVTSNTSTLTVMGRQLESLQLTPSSLHLAKGTQAPFKVMATYDDGVNVDITHKASVRSDNPSVTFIHNGEISGIGTGKAQLYAAFDGLRSNFSEVDVIDPTIKALQITPLIETIAVHGRVDYIAHAQFSNNDENINDDEIITVTQDVSDIVAWKSKDIGVVSFTHKTATGIDKGHSEITAKLDKYIGEGDLTVSDKTLNTLQVTPGQQHLPEGLISKYTATGSYSDDSSEDLTDIVNWISSDSNIATLYAGEVEAVSPGVVSIRAKYRGKESNNAKLTVENIHLTSINVTPAAEKIPAGTSMPYQALGIYSNYTTQDITGLAHWKSSETDVATVVQEERSPLKKQRTVENMYRQNSSYALVAGIMQGVTEISAELDGIESNIATLEINEALLENLQITPGFFEVPKGNEIQYRVMGYFADETSMDVTHLVQWDNSKPDIASLIKGNAIAIKEGNTEIKASINKIKSNVARLSVTAKTIDKIQITPAVQTVALGVEQQYTAIGIYSDGTMQEITKQAAWKSSDTDKATIIDGLAATLESGVVNITASFDGKRSNEATLTVSNKKLIKLQLTPTVIDFALGTSKSLQVLATYTDSSTQDITDNVIWALSNDLIASIDPEQGKITATKPGASQLVAHWRNNNIKSNTAKITVSKATLDSLHITPLSQEIIVNNTGKFEALGMYSDNSAQDLTDFVDWSSSDPNKATILQGEVLGFEEGTVQISASYNDLKAAQNVKADKATLKIIADTLSKITVIPEFKTMAKGTTQQFNATATYGIQGDIDITKDNDTSWYSESENLTIDENGLATAINKEKDIKVSAVKEGKKGTVQVNITSETIKTLTIDTFIPEHTKNLTTGSQLELQAIATMTDETEQDVSSLTNWSESSGSAHLTLRGAVITAQAPGTTEISAQYQDVKAESNITINTIERSNSSCDIPSITMSTGDTTSLTFLCPPTTKEIPSTYSLTAMGFMGPAGMQMPFVTWSVANEYCKANEKRLPKKEELYALMQHVNSPNKKGPGLYLKYGWPMFLNYWSANKSGFNYWTVNMYSRFSWPAITNDSKVYSFSCVKDIVKK